MKEWYFSCLLNNQIIDVSSSCPGSHIDTNNSQTEENTANPVSCTDSNIKSISDLFKKITDKSKLSIALNSCESYKSKNELEKAIKKFMFTSKKVIELKIFKDRLKSTTKCHLNGYLKSLKYLPESDVPLIKFPIVQIAGMNGNLPYLSMKEKKMYVLEDVCSFRFPRHLAHIKNHSKVY
ncbi:hypothetical protein INT48_009531 [Thamnidium elegans]|uniref:Uncharacterized protein n=1 Tax=Thamnidium elegans TaxID=101142 RepID=A0A8H7T046_9FUNG|nr:hypothetical protein INT48_009531 [Thamnidium elegans]